MFVLKNTQPDLSSFSNAIPQQNDSQFGFQFECLILSNSESSSQSSFFRAAHLSVYCFAVAKQLLQNVACCVITQHYLMISSSGTKTRRVPWRSRFCVLTRFRFAFGQQIVIFKLHPSVILLLLPFSVRLCLALPSHFCALCGTAQWTYWSWRGLLMTCTQTVARKERHGWCVFGFSCSMREETRSKRDGHRSWTFTFPAPGWMLSARRVVCTCSGAFGAFLRRV